MSEEDDTLDETASLAEVIQWLRERVEKGAHCPACQQYAKVYKRPLHTAMAYALIKLYRADLNAPDAYFHMPTLLDRKNSGDDAKLRYWGLTEMDPERQAWWRITPHGRAFVRGEITVPQKARIYNDRCLNLLGKEITIRDALGKKFDYVELMST